MWGGEGVSFKEEKEGAEFCGDEFQCCKLLRRKPTSNNRCITKTREKFAPRLGKTDAEFSLIDGVSANSEIEREREREREREK